MLFVVLKSIFKTLYLLQKKAVQLNTLFSFPYFRRARRNKIFWMGLCACSNARICMCTVDRCNVLVAVA
jgi:hypothetical protein